MLNKQKGNMYGFVNYTWNAIKGKCSHNCSYCYMKPFWRSEVHLDEKELQTNLGEGNFIFVGSGTDMFADEVNGKWIEKVLSHCENFPKNNYLFQTKNPVMFHKYKDYFPEGCYLGITIETNRENDISDAPKVEERVSWMEDDCLIGKRKMVTIEPIMDCDVSHLIELVKRVRPEFVNIGADSKGHKLPEPSEFKIQLLIKGLEKFTKVNLKPNLKRLYSPICSNSHNSQQPSLKQIGGGELKSDKGLHESEKGSSADTLRGCGKIVKIKECGNKCNYTCGDITLITRELVLCKECSNAEVEKGVSLSTELPTTCECKNEKEAEENECIVCGQRDCPGDEYLHYHHDGCPHCIFAEVKG